MRKIKFRAFDKRLKVMDYSPVGDEWSCEGTPVNETLNSKYFFSEDGDSYYSPLMQFTGLHDKNGKEIWEGDLVMEFDYILGKECGPYQVLFDDGMFQLSCYAGRPLHECNEMRIIGNVYENKDLLN